MDASRGVGTNPWRSAFHNCGPIRQEKVGRDVCFHPFPASDTIVSEVLSSCQELTGSQVASLSATVGPRKELRNSSRDLVFLSSPFETGVSSLLPSSLPFLPLSLLSSIGFHYERTLLSCLSIYCFCYHHFIVLSVH